MKRRTCVVVRHACDILARMIDAMLANDLKFIVLGQCPTWTHMDFDDMQTTIFCSTREAVNTLQDANTFDSSVVLAIRVPRLAGDISFQPCRIPYFDRFIVRSRDEKHVIRRHS